jgi:hypothetical protein
MGSDFEVSVATQPLKVTIIADESKMDRDRFIHCAPKKSVK